MNCALAILLPNFSYRHDTSCPLHYYFVYFLGYNHKYIFDKILENPSFLKKKLLVIAFLFIEKVLKYYGIAALPKGARNNDVSQ